MLGQRVECSEAIAAPNPESNPSGYGSSQLAAVLRTCHTRTPAAAAATGAIAACPVGGRPPAPGGGLHIFLRALPIAFAGAAAPGQGAADGSEHVPARTMVTSGYPSLASGVPSVASCREVVLNTHALETGVCNPQASTASAALPTYEGTQSTLRSPDLAITASLQQDPMGYSPPP